MCAQEEEAAYIAKVGNLMKMIAECKISIEKNDQQKLEIDQQREKLTFSCLFAEKNLGMSLHAHMHTTLHIHTLTHTHANTYH